MILDEAAKKHSNVDLSTNKEESTGGSESQIKATPTKGTTYMVSVIIC